MREFDQHIRFYKDQEGIMKYICKNCGKLHETNTRLWRCECGGAFWLKREEKVRFTKADIKQNEYSMWRYEKAYPMKKADLAASFGEGLTPLVEETWDGMKVWFKNDSLMPTGSFKDRGVVMLVNSLAAKGVTKITEDSSGNAGASVSAYAAKAGIECNVYVPASTSEGKVTQVIASGAKLHKIPGLRDRAAEAAQSGAEGVYASHNWNPYFVEGVKSMAYEIWEQSGFTAPDNIVVPTGNGSIPCGLEQGFRELMESGEIDHMPRICGVQPENCNPIYRKFHGEADEFEASATIAEGIALKFSSHRDEVVEAVRRSEGTMVSVTEDEILQALKKIMKKGFYIEPTSCATFAGATSLIKDGFIKQDQKTVIVISGNGLKASEKIFHYLQQ